MALFSLSGATINTSPISLRASAKTRIPFEYIPSSLVTKIINGSAIFHRE